MRTSGGLSWTRQWTFGFHKMLGNSWAAERLLVSQEGLRSMELVDIRTGNRLDSRGICVQFPERANWFLSFPYRSDRVWGPHTSIHQAPGAFSAGVKRLRHLADHSPPSSVEVKNAWRHNLLFLFTCVLYWVNTFIFTQRFAVELVLGWFRIRFTAWKAGILTKVLKGKVVPVLN
jgi:hypothetical protein